jgi:hypothetical protein
MGLYKVYNGPMPTTAVLAKVTTGTNIKTMLQIKLGASTNQVGNLVSWGCSFDGSAAATPGSVELLSTKTVGATITEFVAADIINLSDPNAAAVTDDFPLALTAAGDESGYTATAEGSITATRLFDAQLVAPTNQYIYEWALGREAKFRYDEFVRIRMHFGTAVNALCWIVFEI